jgi:hypothetical protein
MSTHKVWSKEQFGGELKNAFIRRKVDSAPIDLGRGAMARNAKDKGARGALELPTELIQARRFGKTRSAQSGALLEDYVELISDLLATSGEARPTDVARRLGVSHAT